jgi:hypothetical protein
MGCGTGSSRSAANIATIASATSPPIPRSQPPESFTTTSTSEPSSQSQAIRHGFVFPFVIRRAKRVAVTDSSIQTSFSCRAPDLSVLPPMRLRQVRGDEDSAIGERTTHSHGGIGVGNRLNG